jgi:hypothetical protein
MYIYDKHTHVHINPLAYSALSRQAGLKNNIRKGDSTDHCGVGYLPALVPIPQAFERATRAPRRNARARTHGTNERDIDIISEYDRSNDHDPRELRSHTAEQIMVKVTKNLVDRGTGE